MAYSYDALKSNLTRLMQERSLRIVDLEAKAKKGRVVNNILNGASTNPTIDTVQSLAEALNIDIEDLLSEQHTSHKLNDLLFMDAAAKVVQEINPLVEKHHISINNIFSLIKDAYNYAIELDLPEADQKFIKWLIKQKYNS